MSTTTCELAQLVIESQQSAHMFAAPTFEYSAGEPPDQLALLAALVPSGVDREALLSCETLNLSYADKNGDFFNYEQAEFLAEISEPLLVTVWAELADEEALKWPLGDLLLIKPSYADAAQIELARIEAIYTYGQVLELPPNRALSSAGLAASCENEQELAEGCNQVQYECQFLDDVRTDQEWGLHEQCEDLNDAMTQITFDTKTARMTFQTIDAILYPPGGYNFEILEVLGAKKTSQTALIQIQILEAIEPLNSQASGPVDKRSKRRRLQLESLYPDCGFMFDLSTLTSLTMPGFAFEYTLTDQLALKINLPSCFTEPVSCPCDYIVDLDGEDGDLVPYLSFIPGIPASVAKFGVEQDNYFELSQTNQSLDILDGQESKTFEIDVTAKVSGLPDATTKVKLTLKNPCYDQQFVVLTFNGLFWGFDKDFFSYYLTDPKGEFTHTKALIYYDLPDLCGILTYEAKLDDEPIDSGSEDIQYDATQQKFSVFSENFNLLTLDGIEQQEKDFTVTVEIYFNDYPNGVKWIEETTLKVKNPCRTKEIGFSTSKLQSETYYYQNQAKPSVKILFENYKDNPDQQSDSFIRVPEPQDKCFQQLVFTCSMLIEPYDCDIDTQSTKIQFDETTGTLTFQSRDKASFPPSDIMFLINIDVGQGSIYPKTGITFLIKTEDPCPTATLELATPRIMQDVVYLLGDSAFSYHWNDSNLVTKNTLVDCGNTVVDIFYADGTAFDAKLFYLDQQPNKGAFIIKETSDQNAAGIYSFKFRAYFQEQPANFYELPDPFTIEIKNMCDPPQSLSVPQSLDNINSGLYLNYTIQAEPVRYTMDAFVVEPDFCQVSYTLDVDNFAGYLAVKSWDESTRALIFDHQGGLELLDGDPKMEFKDYEFTIRATSGQTVKRSASAQFTLRVQNPCTTSSQAQSGSGSKAPEWCPQEDKPFWMPQMPLWMEQIEDQTLYVGQSMRYEFGEPVSRFNLPVNVTVNTGIMNRIAVYDDRDNALDILEVMEEDLGYWRFVVVADEVRANFTYTYKKTFYLNIVHNQTSVEPDDQMDPSESQGLGLQKIDLIQESSFGKPQAYVHGFDASGLMTIGWSQKMKPYHDYDSIKNSTIIVKGKPRNLKVTKGQKFDKIVEVRKNQTEIDMLVKDTLELGAIEIQIIDNTFSVQADINFEWDIVDFTEDHLQIQIAFENSKYVSDEFDYDDAVLVTFWDTQFFRNQDDDEEIPFGWQLKWDVIRQMQLSEKESVESAIGFSHFLYVCIGMITLLLILTGGPLLSVWIYVNSMQLVAQVILVSIKLPGNAHFFLLDHLRVHLQLFGLTKWLQEVSSDKQHDSALVLNDWVTYYTTLTYSCGFSFNFVPNLLLWLIFLIILGAIWIALWSCDRYDEIVRKPTVVKLREPWLTNFTIRWLYEIYLQICICIMINVSSYGESSGSVWYLCLLVAVFIFATPICVSLLFCCKGPYYQDTYEKDSLLWGSFWGIRAIKQELALKIMHDQSQERGRSSSSIDKHKVIPVGQQEAEGAVRQIKISNQDVDSGDEASLQEVGNARRHQEGNKGIEMDDRCKKVERDFFVPEADQSQIISNFDDDGEKYDEFEMEMRKNFISNQRNAMTLNEQQQSQMSTYMPIRLSNHQDRSSLNFQSKRNFYSDGRGCKQDDGLIELESQKIEFDLKNYESQNQSASLEERMRQLAHSPSSRNVIVFDHEMKQNSSIEKKLHQISSIAITEQKNHSVIEQAKDDSLTQNYINILQKEVSQDENQEAHFNKYYEGGGPEVSLAQQLNIQEEQQTTPRNNLDTDRQLVYDERTGASKRDSATRWSKMAHLRLQIESQVKVSDRYKTLFYGLKLNHPHNAAIVHPLVYLLRRIIGAAIVIFCLSVPMLGTYVLLSISLSMIAFILVEHQWEDPLILMQHIVNEIALYSILAIALICSLPVEPSHQSKLGLAIISIVLVSIVFNLAIMAYVSATYLVLYCKRHRIKIQLLAKRFGPKRCLNRGATAKTSSHKVAAAKQKNKKQAIKKQSSGFAEQKITDSSDDQDEEKQLSSLQVPKVKPQKPVQELLRAPRPPRQDIMQTVSDINMLDSVSHQSERPDGLLNNSPGANIDVVINQQGQNKSPFEREEATRSTTTNIKIDRHLNRSESNEDNTGQMIRLIQRSQKIPVPKLNLNSIIDNNNKLQAADAKNEKFYNHSPAPSVLRPKVIKLGEDKSEEEEEEQQKQQRQQSSLTQLDQLNESRTGQTPNVRSTPEEIKSIAGPTSTTRATTYNQSQKDKQVSASAGARTNDHQGPNSIASASSKNFFEPDDIVNNVKNKPDQAKRTESRSNFVPSSKEDEKFVGNTATQSPQADLDNRSLSIGQDDLQVFCEEIIDAKNVDQIRHTNENTDMTRSKDISIEVTAIAMDSFDEKYQQHVYIQGDVGKEDHHNLVSGVRKERDGGYQIDIYKNDHFGYVDVHEPPQLQKQQQTSSVDTFAFMDSQQMAQDRRGSQMNEDNQIEGRSPYQKGIEHQSIHVQNKTVDENTNYKQYLYKDQKNFQPTSPSLESQIFSQCEYFSPISQSRKANNPEQQNTKLMPSNGDGDDGPVKDPEVAILKIYQEEIPLRLDSLNLQTDPQTNQMTISIPDPVRDQIMASRERQNEIQQNNQSNLSRGDGVNTSIFKQNDYQSIVMDQRIRQQERNNSLHDRGSPYKDDSIQQKFNRLLKQSPQSAQLIHEKYNGPARGDSSMPIFFNQSRKRSTVSQPRMNESMLRKPQTVQVKVRDNKMTAASLKPQQSDWMQIMNSMFQCDQRRPTRDRSIQLRNSHSKQHDPIQPLQMDLNAQTKNKYINNKTANCKIPTETMNTEISSDISQGKFNKYHDYQLSPEMQTLNNQVAANGQSLFRNGIKQNCSTQRRENELTSHWNRRSTQSNARSQKPQALLDARANNLRNSQERLSINTYDESNHPKLKDYRHQDREYVLRSQASSRAHQIDYRGNLMHGGDNSKASREHIVMSKGGPALTTFGSAAQHALEFESMTDKMTRINQYANLSKQQQHQTPSTVLDNNRVVLNATCSHSYLPQIPEARSMTNKNTQQKKQKVVAGGAAMGGHLRKISHSNINTTMATVQSRSRSRQPGMPDEARDANRKSSQLIRSLVKNSYGQPLHH